MADYDADDPFSDDGLDDLPLNTLHELEQKAFLSTQQAQASVAQPPRKDKFWHPHRLPQINGPVEYEAAGDSLGVEDNNLPPSSDYGFDDEDVIDLDHPSAVIAARHITPKANRVNQVAQREQWPQQRYAGLPLREHQQPSKTYNLVNRNVHSQAPHGNSQYQEHNTAANNQRVNGIKPGSPGDLQDGSKQFDVGELQARILELERERAVMQKSIEDAKSLALAKSGEIAIVRANQDKATKEYERRMAVTKKLHAEAIAKQKAEIEAARKDREKMETNTRFLEHDLAEEAKKARNVKKKVLKDGTGNISRVQPALNVSPAATPKKNKAAPFRDGFDDDEVMLISPSKEQKRGKQNASTPKAAKRKRLASETNSPGQPLPISGSGDSPRLHHGASTEEQVGDKHIETSATILMDDSIFQFMHTLHNHRPYEGHDRTFEALSRHHLPSSPQKSLYGILYDSLSGLPRCGKGSLPIEVCKIVLSMWSDCLGEKHYAPIYLLLDLLQLVFALSSSAAASALIETVVPLCQATADLVAVPLAKASTAQPTPTTIKKPPLPPPPPQGIDVYEVLSLLQAVALSCCAAPASDITNLVRFWTKMEYDFVLLMLNKAQPLPEITVMLNLLTTSPLEDTFGAIVHGDGAEKQERQSKNEAGLIERLTLLLFNIPLVPRDEEPYEATEVLDLRIEVLTTLSSIGTTKHGGSTMAKHPNAIGHLVRFMHDTIDRLYHYTPDETLNAKLSIAVNLSTRLLAYLLVNFRDSIDMKQKLAVIPEGIHKHLIALARLAFTKMVFFEKGIEEEVSDLAHEMLDEFLSPEEGEALMEAFGVRWE